MSLSTRFFALLTVLFAFTLIPACGGGDDGNGTGPDGDEFQVFVGTWVASSAVFTNPEAPSESIDVIAFGASLEIVVTSNRRFTITSSAPGEGTETESGDIEVEGGQLALTFDDDGTTDTQRLDYTLSNGDQTLAVSYEGDEEYDFDDDGTDDPAEVEIVLQKE